MYDRKRVEEFRSDTVEKYKDRTIVGEAISRELYDPAKHNGEYFQTGVRTNLPKKFFTEGNITVALSTDYARSVFISERNHLLRGLDNKSDDGKVLTVGIDDFTPNELFDAIEEVNNPTDIFIPAAFSDDLHSWITDDMLDFNVTATYLETDSGNVRIRWVPNKHGFENIYAINSDQSKIVQKQEKYAGDVSYIDEIQDCKFNSPDDLLMTYFGEIQDDPEEFDFFIRTILSNPIVTSQSACIIDTGRVDIEFENENSDEDDT